MSDAVQNALDQLSSQVANGSVTLDTIKNLANNLSANLEPDVDTYVFYSGQYANGVSSNAVAIELAARSSSIGVIDNTDVAKFLSNSIVRDAVEIVAGFDEAKAADYLTGGPGSLWGDASARYAASVSGNVIALSPSPNNYGIW